MVVASFKNRRNTVKNAKIWQFLLKATKLVSLNWKMTPNYSVYFGLMGKRFLSEKCCGLYWNEGCSLDLGSKNSGYIGMRVLLECGFNWKKYGIFLVKTLWLLSKIKTNIANWRFFYLADWGWGGCGIGGRGRDWPFGDHAHLSFQPLLDFGLGRTIRST